jgi:hypothetical protein
VKIKYYNAMQKTTFFKRLIKKNRKELLSKGFLASTLTMWAKGNRHPRKKQAVKIAKALSISIDKIPYREEKLRLI